MNKEKLYNNSSVKDNDTETSGNPYLPKMRTNYQPSDESVESGTGVDFPINMPNPAVDPIVVNNIASQEFDYTQDMLSPDDYNLEKDSKQE